MHLYYIIPTLLTATFLQATPHKSAKPILKTKIAEVILMDGGSGSDIPPSSIDTHKKELLRSSSPDSVSSAAASSPTTPDAQAFPTEIGKKLARDLEKVSVTDLEKLKEMKTKKEFSTGSNSKIFQRVKWVMIAKHMMSRLDQSPPLLDYNKVLSGAVPSETISANAKVPSWEFLDTLLQNLEQEHFKSKNFVHEWMSKLQRARETLENELAVRYRVGRVLESLLKLPKNEGSKVRKIMEDSIRDFSDACDDRALSGLEKAEFLVSSISGDEKAIFSKILAQVKRLQLNRFLYESPIYNSEGSIAFQRRSTRNANVTEESLETALYHELLFSNFGDFGIKSKTMAHSSYAQTSRADIALDFVLGELTFENIVSGIMSQEIFENFRSFALDTQLKKMLPSLRKYMFDDPESREEEIALALNQKIPEHQAYFDAYVTDLAIKKGLDPDDYSTQDFNKFLSAQRTKLIEAYITEQLTKDYTVKNHKEMITKYTPQIKDAFKKDIKGEYVD